MKPQNPLLKIFALFVFIAFMIFFVSYKSGYGAASYGKENHLPEFSSIDNHIPEFSGTDTGINDADTVKRLVFGTAPVRSTYMSSSKSMQLLTTKAIVFPPRSAKPWQMPKKGKIKAGKDSLQFIVPADTIRTQ